MNRPLALIQGNLALPNARLLRGLPPPYGMYRWPARAATPLGRNWRFRMPCPRVVARTFTPLRRAKSFAFSIKLPTPRDNSPRFAERTGGGRQLPRDGQGAPVFVPFGPCAGGDDLRRVQHRARVVAYSRRRTRRGTSGNGGGDNAAVRGEPGARVAVHARDASPNRRSRPSRSHRTSRS